MRPIHQPNRCSSVQHHVSRADVLVHEHELLKVKRGDILQGMIIMLAYREFVVKPSFHLRPGIEWTGAVVCEESTPDKDPLQEGQLLELGLTGVVVSSPLSDGSHRLFGLWSAIPQILTHDIVHNQVITPSFHRTRRGRLPGMSGKPWESGLKSSL